ncbi:MAG: DsbA family protein [Schleiferiaceae bacterium]|nr:DsbA family protein [Schleiferiaceae bacterium]
MLTLVEQCLYAHRLLHWAGTFNKANELKEVLFRAHFTDGLDLVNLTVLADLAGSVGLDAQEARAVLETGQYADDALADLKLADRFNIRGVPFFVFNRQFSVSGAQPVTVFLRALEQASAEG